MADLTVEGFTTQLKVLSDEAENFTNNFKRDLKRRFKALTKREKRLINEVQGMQGFIESGTASEDLEAEYLAKRNALLRTRLDLLDTREAYATLEIDSPQNASLAVDFDGEPISLDSREQHK